MAPQVETIAVYVAGAIIYALVTFFSKRTKPGGEPFAPKKFARAVIMGVIVGVYAASVGAELNAGNFLHYATAIGAGGLADQIVKWIWRQFGLSALLNRG